METIAIKCLNLKDFREVERILTGNNLEWFSGRQSIPAEELDIEIFPLYIFIDENRILSIGDEISKANYQNVPVVSSRKIIRKKKLNQIIGSLEL